MIPCLAELEPATTSTRTFLAALRARGLGGLADDLATRVVGSTDNSIYQNLPQAILYPRRRDDVVLLMRTAAEAALAGLTLTLAPTGSRGRPASSSTRSPRGG